MATPIWLHGVRSCSSRSTSIPAPAHRWLPSADAEADLVLVIGNHLQPPCPGLVASSTFRGGKTMLAGRSGERLPRDITELDHQVLAVLEGGRMRDGWPRAIRTSACGTWPIGTPRWQLLKRHRRSGNRPGNDPAALIRRHFAGHLHLQPSTAISPPTCTCLRATKIASCWSASSRHCTRSRWRSMPACCSYGPNRRPASLEHVLDWMRQLPAQWLPALAAALAVAPFLWHARHRRLR
jgi:hypothetical protein